MIFTGCFSLGVCMTSQIIFNFAVTHGTFLITFVHDSNLSGWLRTRLIQRGLIETKTKLNCALYSPLTISLGVNNPDPFFTFTGNMSVFPSPPNSAFHTPDSSDHKSKKAHDIEAACAQSWEYPHVSMGHSQPYVLAISG